MGGRVESLIACTAPNSDAETRWVYMGGRHCTCMQSGTAALQRMTDAGAKVSAHYMVAEDGNGLRLVDEDRRAWHAGKSFWRGITDVKSARIGIEIVNPGHEFGYRP